MGHRELSERIFQIDDTIRFVAFIRKSGDVEEWRVREGIEPIGSEKERHQWFNQVAFRARTYDMFDKDLGKIRMAYVEKDKTKQLTFYLPELIVFVTLKAEIDGIGAIRIADSIGELISSTKLI